MLVDGCDIRSGLDYEMTIYVGMTGWNWMATGWTQVDWRGFGCYEGIEEYVGGINRLVIGIGLDCLDWIE